MLLINICLLFSQLFSPGEKVGYLNITKEQSIDQSTALYVEMALNHFREQKVSSILLRLDTPGGEVFSALKIANALQKIDREDKIPVIAYIDDWAISAGAMLAYSCRTITVSPTASMGAAEPIQMSQSGQMETASEKVNSALRSEFANLARLYGRNAAVAEAMVDKDIILVKRGEEIIKLLDEKEILSSDQLLSAKGKLLTLTAKELIDWKVADQILTEVQPDLDLVPYKNWRINFFSFLSHPLVSSLLTFGLLIGIYLEAQAPGTGLGALLSVTSLGLILLNSFATHVFHLVEMILLIGGLLLVAIELFILPTFGLLGFVGAAAALVGLFFVITPLDLSFSLPHWTIAFDGWVKWLGIFSATLIFSLIAMILLSRLVLWKTPLFRKFILTNEPKEDIPPFLPEIGTKAIAATTLRPSGKIRLGDKLYESISTGEYIEVETAVEVVGQEGGRLIVTCHRD